MWEGTPEGASFDRPANRLPMEYPTGAVDVYKRQVNLPVIVAYDGFFTSHQKHRCAVMARDEDARAFVGPHKPAPVSYTHLRA